jgi:hypothetical protein
MAPAGKLPKTARAGEERSLQLCTTNCSITHEASDLRAELARRLRAADFGLIVAS